MNSKFLIVHVLDVIYDKWLHTNNLKTPLNKSEWFNAVGFQFSRVKVDKVDSFDSQTEHASWMLKKRDSSSSSALLETDNYLEKKTHLNAIIIILTK